jgi:hypothetical protein
VNDHSPRLRIIGQLAKEYEQKYKELQKLVSESPPERVVLQLLALSERTTDRFRSAQVALFSSPGLSEEKDEPFRAAAAMSRAFDEMRILFQFAMQNSVEDRGREETGPEEG